MNIISHTHQQLSEAESVLTAQLLALEITANLCYTESEWNFHHSLCDVTYFVITLTLWIPWGSAYNKEKLMNKVLAPSIITP